MLLQGAVEGARGLRIVASAFLVSSLLAGCAGSGGQSSGVGAAGGAALGALAGGLIGNQVGGTRGAWMGAIGGGVLGAMIGDAIERQEIARQQQQAMASGRGVSRRITNEQGREVTVRTSVQTVPKGDGSGLSCKQFVSYLGAEEAAKRRRCQINQGGAFDTDP